MADHEAAGLSGACHELAAAAESGWDFSSRWAGLSSRGRSASTAASSEDRDKSTSSMEGEDGEDEEEGGAFRLSATATTSVVPVDLNAFLHRAELNIARLHHALAGHRTNRKQASSSSETAVDPTPPPTMPPLLSLNGIQRRFLSRRRCSMKSWSSMSSTLMEKLARQGELGFGSEEADTTSPTASGGSGGGGLGLESRPLSRKAMLFAAAARARAKAMEQTMWDGRSAFWRDLLLPTGEQSPSVTPACFVPMWAGLPWPVLDDDDDSGIAESADRLGRSVKALRSSGLVQPGGVRTSLEDSGQQWDGRNAWPPLQWMIIQGLRNSASALTPPATAAESAAAITAGAATATAIATQAARQLASEVEEAFLDGALAGWETTGAMMEKYDADEVGKGGGGGEYNLQVGFGWTNGVALDLIAGSSKRPTLL
ncbi:Trehalase C-terminal fragment, family GH37 [Ectocarpus siliculosus]|uniref:alpha,alpha-trehalase n=1 Tax=Ectocarpus siliculosus TaxID=2880 RepID=D7G6T3_ECTSI|nr:Trehalase C-terminal fragment, family GH37 [Ectocarpus siliculosus]